MTYRITRAALDAALEGAGYSVPHREGGIEADVAYRCDDAGRIVRAIEEGDR